MKLLEEISNEPENKTIIFVETKRKVDDITRAINRYGWQAIGIHGDKSQQERDYVLNRESYCYGSLKNTGEANVNDIFI